HSLFRYHHHHHQRRPGGCHQDHPRPTLRNRVSFSRARLRIRHWHFDARVLHFDGQRLRARSRREGAHAMRRSAVAATIVGALALLVLVWTLAPVAWMVVSSFKPTPAIKTASPTWLFEPTLEHYRDLIGAGNDVTPFAKNSLLAA